jgi:hypothetical protein
MKLNYNGEAIFVHRHSSSSARASTNTFQKVITEKVPHLKENSFRIYFNLDLSNDAFCSYDYKTSGGKFLVNDNLERMPDSR